MTRSNTRSRTLAGLLLGAIVACVAGQPVAAGMPRQSSAADTGAEYRIQVGDELDVKFFYNPELNEHVIVRPDGRISLQLVPEMVVANLTPAALSKQLTDAYAADLRQPRITVIVRSFGAQRVFVDGEVGKPGMVPILGLMTAMQAIAEAGGMKDTARQTEVLIIRRGPANKPIAFQVNLKKAHDRTDLSQDVGLGPFDIVYVPKSRIANMNQWVDQYIRKNIPIPFGLQFGLFR